MKKNISRFFYLGLVSGVLITGVVSCGDTLGSGTDVPTETSDGTGGNDKPTAEEKSEFAQAKARKLDITHKAVQIISLSEKTLALRVVVNISGQDYSMTLTPSVLGIGDLESIPRQLADGAQLEIILNRVQLPNGKIQALGIEYRLSRTGAGANLISSQFLRLRLDKLNNTQIVTKQKFEFPSKSNITDWVLN